MARKRHAAEEIVTKLRQVDVLSSQGKSIAKAVRSIGVTEVTYYSVHIPAAAPCFSRRRRVNHQRVLRCPYGGTCENSHF
jgi:hypothetical protein